MEGNGEDLKKKKKTYLVNANSKTVRARFRVPYICLLGNLRLGFVSVAAELPGRRFEPATSSRQDFCRIWCPFPTRPNSLS